MTETDPPAAQLRGAALARHFAALPQAVAVAISGSLFSGAADTGSDIDLYVYTDAEVAPATHAALVERLGGSPRADLNLPYWGGVNTWIDPASGIMVDCMYFGAAWMEEQVARALDQHMPAMGYSTCFCRTVRQSRVLHDPRGWLAALQARTAQPYPEPLRHNIIAYNHPPLRTMMTSYMAQIASAVRRGDGVSVNHRLAALLASYFDILFALNRVLHPGEKRLLAFARSECAMLPEALEQDMAAVLAAAAPPSPELIAALGRLLDHLDALLLAAGFDPAQLTPPAL